MSIRFSCSACGKAMKVADEWAGKRARCPGCKNPLSVPYPEPAPIEPMAVIPFRASPPPLPRVVPSTQYFPPVAQKRGLKPAYLVTLIVLAVFVIGGLFVYRVVQAVNKIRLGLPSPMAAQTPLSQGTSNPIFPDRPQALSSENGVDVYPMTIDGTGPGLPMRIRLYLPAGRHDPHSLPCVFIAPAGTRLLHGSALVDEDSPEHLPYATAGFAVLAYELSGDLPNTHGTKITFNALKKPVQQFMDADGGLANARAAVDYVLAKVPEVDSAQMYTAGHSSAATMALNLVAADHRFKAVAAYAPACDVQARWGTDLATMNKIVPGAINLAARVSPMLHVNEMACPIFLFHADDDTNVRLNDNLAYVAALRAAGKTVQFQRVPTGGHYHSMIDQGIPDGIQFFESQGAHPLPPIVH